MRIHPSLGPLAISSTMALVACGNPVSLGQDSGAVGSTASGTGTGGGAASTSSSGSGGTASGGAGGAPFARSHVPDYIVVDDANVYWADQGTVFGAAKSGGKPWTIASAPPVLGPPSVWDLGVDSTGVYYTESVAPMPGVSVSSAIMRAPLLGGAPSLVAQAGTLACFTLAGASLYHTEQFVDNTPGGAIYQTPTAGGPTVTVIVEPQATGADPDHQKVTPIGLVVDATSLYWMNIGPEDGTPADSWGVAGATLLGGAPMRIGDATPHQGGSCMHIVADDSNVYWVRQQPSPGVVSAPKQGGPETVLAPDSAENLVIDDTYVYYVTADPTGGSVRRVAKSGGSPEILADGQQHPFGIAVDATDVYWTTLGTLNAEDQYVGDGAVLRMAKP